MDAIRHTYATTNMRIPDMDISLLSFYLRLHGTRTIREFVRDYGQHGQHTADYRILGHVEFETVLVRLKRCERIPFTKSITIDCWYTWTRGECFNFYEAAGFIREKLDGGEVSPVNPDGHRLLEDIGNIMTCVRKHIDIGALLSLLDAPLCAFGSVPDIDDDVRIGDILLTCIEKYAVSDYPSYRDKRATLQCAFLGQLYAYISVVSLFMGIAKQWSAAQRMFHNTIVHPTCQMS